MTDNENAQNAPIDNPGTEPANPTQDSVQNAPIDNPGTEPANPYNTIIEQQQAQIDALIAQTTALNSQIINMVNNGAQLNDNKLVQPAQSVQPVSLSDDTDYSLESLAKEIGKR